METENATQAFEDPRFTALFEEYMKMQINAEQELLLPEEPDNGNVEYKLRFDAPNMARVEHLTTQMAFRLNEGNGTAYYQIGVLDSGQVTGLSDEEVLETLLVLFYMSTALQANLSVHKVRVGLKGHSCMLKLTRQQKAETNVATELLSLRSTNRIQT